MGKKKTGFALNPQNINRSGRPPREEAYTALIKEQGELKDVKDKTKRVKRKDALVQKLWSMALAGDFNAMRYIFDRVDGRPLQLQESDMEVSGLDSFIEALQRAHAQSDDVSEK